LRVAVGGKQGGLSPKGKNIRENESEEKGNKNVKEVFTLHLKGSWTLGRRSFGARGTPQ
jgi:hypothetical protein